PQRVRERQVPGQLQLVPAADAPGRRAPLADAVERQDRRLVERGRQKGAGRVTLVVVEEQERRGGAGGQRPADEAAQVDLVLQPDRHRLAEAAEPAGGERQVRFQQPLELRQRLLEVGDVVELARRQPGLAQTILDRPAREAGVVLLAGEALLLGGGDDLAVHDEG